MAENSTIEWTDHTTNIWWGCSKEHTGCKNCYAETLSNRWGNKIWGEKVGRKRIKSAFSDLVKYQKQASNENRLYKVFVGSMMDIFEDDKNLINPIPGYNTISDLRCRLFAEIESGDYPNLLFLFLTKRPGNIGKFLPSEIKYMDNLWFGTSISNPDTVSYGRTLQEQDVKNRFLSIEPQVERISYEDLGGILHSIGWVIQGGESGNKKRPFNIHWAYEMKEICEAYNTPYFFKQIDKVQSIPDDLMIREFPDFSLYHKMIMDSI